MKLTLMIEGSASAIAAILASLPQDGSVTVTTPLPTTGAAPAVATSPLPSPVPLPVAPSSDDDDTGPVDLGAPAVDSSGLPWDERIHAATKATVADGTWRKKRGVDPALVASVEAILRSHTPPPAVAMPVVAAAAPVAVPQPVPMPTVAVTAPPMPVAVPEPVAPPMPVAAPEPVAPPAASTTPFQAFMSHMAEQMQKLGADGLPLVHADYLAQITNEISAAFAPQGIKPLTVITDIKDEPAMIDYAIALFTRDNRW